MDNINNEFKLQEFPADLAVRLSKDHDASFVVRGYDDCDDVVCFFSTVIDGCEYSFEFPSELLLECFNRLKKLRGDV